ncbi:MAG: hypothetical protein WD048_07320 [Chitinophagales bacterium]
MKRIKRIGIFQTAKVFGIVYFLITAFFMIPFALISTVMSDYIFPEIPFSSGIVFVILPFIYGVLGFVVIPIVVLNVA